MKASPLIWIQDRVLASFGRAPAARGEIVRRMLRPGDGEVTGYWLQLVIAAMLATLGLALNSTAVVIGAMLIAPLMRPLVEIAMGLATGSAELALRATLRTMTSIVVVVGVATLIAWLLPFQAITAELEARTAPTLLDLFVAAACALAAAYATLRSDTDIATTAAGTSIGISLVPPICAVGHGLALGNFAVARGAALLFTANLSGILAIAAGVFVVTGFGRADIRAEEQTLDDAEVARGLGARAGRAWSRLAAARLGAAARVVPPLLLIAIVYLPLHRALDEIQHRNAITHAVAELLDRTERKVVQYSLDQTASGVNLRVVLVGDARAAGDLDAALRQRLLSLDVEAPRVSVWAVPDAAAMSALTRRVDEIPPPPTPEPVSQTVHRYSSDVAKLVRAAWPTSGTGALVGVWLDVDNPDHLLVTHLGPAIGTAGVQLLARALEPGAGRLNVREDALAPIEAPADDGTRWLADSMSLVERARRVSGLHICATLVSPAPRSPRTPPSDVDTVRAVIVAYLAGVPQANIRDGDSWRLAASSDDCPGTEAPK